MSGRGKGMPEGFGLGMKSAEWTVAVVERQVEEMAEALAAAIETDTVRMEVLGSDPH